MRDYVLTCCSTADLTREHLERRELPFVCFHFTMDGQEYEDDLGESMSFAEFYARINAGAMPTTSQVNAQQYMDFFRPFLEEGKDILHVTLSSGISGSYNSACIAQQELSEEYPDRKIYIVDSLSAASGYGLLMEMAADKRDAGLTIEELHEYVEALKLRIQHWVFTTDLTHLRRGGRISAVSAAAGSLLNICPLIEVTGLGKLESKKNVRGKKKVMEEMITKMKTLAVDGTDYAGRCYISHSACEEDAKKLAQAVEAAFPNLKEPVLINSIGTVIGSHTGPGTVALFFEGSERAE